MGRDERIHKSISWKISGWILAQLKLLIIFRNSWRIFEGFSKEKLTEISERIPRGVLKEITEAIYVGRFSETISEGSPENTWEILEGILRDNFSRIFFFENRGEILK